MTKTLCWIIAIATIVAPGLHLVSDVLEWVGGGFSHFQLLINYMGFVLMPFLMLGLYAIQHPRIGSFGLLGSVLYAMAFIYFAHTTRSKIETTRSSYWRRRAIGIVLLGDILYLFFNLSNRRSTYR
jgi:hypothetical protein